MFSMKGKLDLTPKKKYKVDWEKVKSFEDLLVVLSVVDITFTEDYEHFEKLSAWLTPK